MMQPGGFTLSELFIDNAFGHMLQNSWFRPFNCSLKAFTLEIEKLHAVACERMATKSQQKREILSGCSR